MFRFCPKRRNLEVEMKVGFAWIGEPEDVLAALSVSPA
jgi:hypothetical protein